jgi:hypothetical protein
MLKIKNWNVMEVKMIKEIKKWVLFNILKGKAHLMRLGHFLKTGRDIPMLPPPQKDYVRAYFFEIETETFRANHGFTVMFLPGRNDSPVSEFTDIKEIFNLIRKYAKN